ncbi:hypothetical protein [Tautonia plasticadhaerens]|uniref:FG-GAP repeat protein n=1 Tax=Tautonia plasticadhaerens TaxID=2527974 RepID=A0A518HB77_9BACT|nr:hypothetical protein [Tautonia plasticadhaerens]QDV38114.1 hypothetical protein ElP_60630 [Tautonia plasticadhaerens]
MDASTIGPPPGLRQGPRPGRRRHRAPELVASVERLEARLPLDGSLDPGFGRVDLPGRATVEVAGLAEVAGVAALGDDGLVVAGTVGRLGNDDFAVVRLDADGRPDPSFGSGGVATIGFDLGGGDDVDDRARAVLVRPDGQILVVGQVERPGGQLDFAVVRLDADGRPDPSFGPGGDGRVVVGFDLGPVLAERDDVATALAVDADGSIVVVGQVDDVGDENDFGILRLDADGRPDPGFGDDGRAVVGFDLGPGAPTRDDNASAVAIRADGSVLVAGPVMTADGHADFGVARLDARGLPVPSFGPSGDGRVVIGFDLGELPMDRDDLPAALASQPDGRILVAGTVDVAGAGSRFGLVRLLDDGSPDVSFGVAGRVDHPVGAGALAFASALALQPDGRILVAGTARDSDGDSDFGAIRLDPSGRPDVGFGDGGLALIRFDLGPRPLDNDRARGAVLDPAGRLVVAGRVDDGVGGSVVGVARLRTESGPPVFLRLGPVAPSPRNVPVDTVALRFSGPIDPIGLLDGLVLLRDGGVVPLGDGVGVEPVAEGPGDYRILGLGPLTGLDGSYLLTVDASSARDPAGNPGVGTLTVAFRVDATGPRLDRLGPVDPSPRATPVESVEVAFSEAVAPESVLDGSLSLSLSRGGEVVPLGPGVTIEPVAGAPARFRILGLGDATGIDGLYELTAEASGVRDPLGNVGSGRISVGFVVDRTAPRLVSVEQPDPSRRRRGVESLRVEFSEPIDPSLLLDAARLSRGGEVVPLGPGATIEPEPGLAGAYRLQGLGGATSGRGAYELVVDATAVRDPAGNPGVGSGSARFSVRPRAVPADYDGDFISDLATFAVVDGVGRFEIRRSSDGAVRVVELGGPGSFPIDGDYDGDGTTDPAVFGYSPDLGFSVLQYIRSSDGGHRASPFGGPFDFPIGGDYDGDGVTDLAVFGYSPDNGFSRYAVVYSSGRASLTLPFGGIRDFPVVGDYDGDGADDPAVFGFSPVNGFSRFGVVFSGGRPTLTQPFGGPDDVPVAGDYDGDGVTDLAVFGDSPIDGSSRFGVLHSSGRPTLMLPFGGPADVPVGGDYDGDGVTDLAVFGYSPDNGFSRFGIIPSIGAPTRTEPFGGPGTIALPPFSGLFRVQGGVEEAASRSEGLGSAARRAAPFVIPDAPEGRPRPIPSGRWAGLFDLALEHLGGPGPLGT